MQLPAGKTKPMFPNEPVFDPIIREASSAYGVPVSLIKAVIAAESSFRPDVTREEPHVKAPQYGISGDRSHGLMQVLLSTARDRGFTGEPAQLFEPKTNIFIGTKHLRYLLDRYKDTARAIAAYNAGAPRTSGGRFVNQEYVDRVTTFETAFQQAERNGVVLASWFWPLLIGALLVGTLRKA